MGVGMGVGCGCDSECACMCVTRTFSLERGIEIAQAHPSMDSDVGRAILVPRDGLDASQQVEVELVTGVAMIGKFTYTRSCLR